MDAQLVAVHRVGKYMWLELQAGPCLLLHFGMTGFIAIEGKGVAQYVK